GDHLKRELEMDLSRWPAEASRYYSMVSGGFSVSTNQDVVTVGPSFKPAEIRYLGKLKVRGVELELVEYLSGAAVDEAFASQYKLPSELVGSRAQILFGQAKFSAGHGYTLIACRFTSKSDTDWIKPLLAHISALLPAER